MKTKSFYEAPESELLLINFEEAFLQGTNDPPINPWIEDPDDLDDGE